MTDKYKMCFFESQIFFCKRVGTVGINAFNAIN